MNHAGTSSDAPDCTCGCPAATHEHFRGGSDCGACGATACPRYTPDMRHRSRSPTGLGWALLATWALPDHHRRR